MKKGIDRDVAIRQTFSELTFPVWLTIFTTSIGFLSLYFTSIPALKYFGLWTGLGILIMFLALILITPGLLYLVPFKEKRQIGNVQKPFFLHALFSQIIKKRKLIP